MKIFIRKILFPSFIFCFPFIPIYSMAMETEENNIYIKSSLSCLNDDNFCTISKYLRADDIIRLTTVNKKFNKMSENLFYFSIKNKFKSYEEGRYVPSAIFFPKQFSVSWKDQSVLEHLLEISPLSKYCLISFNYLELEERALEVDIKKKGNMRSIIFKFLSTPKIKRDVEDCLDMVRYYGSNRDKNTGTDIKPLLNLLCNNTSLIGIQLHFQHMELGMKSFCKKMAKDKFNYLQILDLRSNGLTNHSASQIASSLSASNINLTALNLSDNDITDIGAGVLAVMLEINTSLKEFDLTFNYIGKIGQKYLQQAWLSTQGSADRYEQNLRLMGNQELKNLKKHYFSELFDEF